ncbi:MAG: hypothetical protein HRT36_00710 [Alphaproteobacteria bacterium]|nr:hypothetical protein [Alphaproteobacteria bacterium]
MTTKLGFYRSLARAWLKNLRRAFLLSKASPPPNPVSDISSTSETYQVVKSEEKRAQLIAIYPDADQNERAKRFGVCQKTIWRALKKLNVTYKQSPDASQSERRQTAVLPTIDFGHHGRQIIDLDESGLPIIRCVPISISEETHNPLSSTLVILWNISHRTHLT